MQSLSNYVLSSSNFLTMTRGFSWEMIAFCSTRKKREKEKIYIYEEEGVLGKEG